MAELPSVHLELRVKGWGERELDVCVPTYALSKKYESEAIKEFDRTDIKKLWKKVCEVYKVEEEMPRVAFKSGYESVAYDFEHGGAFSVGPGIHTKDDGKKLRLVEYYKPQIFITPFIYYVQKMLRIGNEPILAYTIIHEMCHIAAKYIQTPRIPKMGLWFLQAVLGGKEFTEYPVFRRRLYYTWTEEDAKLGTDLSEVLANWGERRVGNELYGNGDVKLELDRKYDKKIKARYLEIMESAKDHAGRKNLLLLSGEGYPKHWKNAKDLELDKLLEYVINIIEENTQASATRTFNMIGSAGMKFVNELSPAKPDRMALAVWNTALSAKFNYDNNYDSR